jgi:hypothetical protein
LPLERLSKFLLSSLSGADMVFRLLFNPSLRRRLLSHQRTEIQADVAILIDGELHQIIYTQQPPEGYRVQL